MDSEYLWLMCPIWDKIDFDAQITCMIRIHDQIKSILTQNGDIIQRYASKYLYTNQKTKYVVVTSDLIQGCRYIPPSSKLNRQLL